MPSDVREVFARTQGAACLWQIHAPDGVRINCHFFYPGEIEFDLDPRELVAQTHVDVVCEFISAIGRTLGRSVAVCVEGGDPRPTALMRYEPALDDVVPKLG